MVYGAARAERSRRDALATACVRDAPFTSKWFIGARAQVEPHAGALRFRDGGSSPIGAGPLRVRARDLTPAA